MPIPSAESCFFYVLLVDPDLIVTPSKINFREDLGTMESVKEIIYQWNGESVLDGDFVECVVVDTHLETAIFLLDKDNWGTIWGYTGFDRSILE